MIDLKDLNVILTGATGGIGNSILEKLVAGGANVIALSLIHISEPTRPY